MFGPSDNVDMPDKKEEAMTIEGENDPNNYYASFEAYEKALRALLKRRAKAAALDTKENK